MRNRKSNGIYFDTSSKSTVYGSGRNARHASFRAEVVIDGIRIRKRFKYHSDAEQWIADMLERPVGTFNKKIDYVRDLSIPTEMMTSCREIEEQKRRDLQRQRDAAWARWEREKGVKPRFEDHGTCIVEIRGMRCIGSHAVSSVKHL